MSVDFRGVDLESLIHQRDAVQFQVCHLNSALYRTLRDALKKVVTERDFRSWVIGFKDTFPKYFRDFFDRYSVDGMEILQKRDLLLSYLQEKNTKNRVILGLVRQQV